MRFYKRRVKTYKAGEMVFTENSECDGMYIVDKGKVRVFKTKRRPKAPKKEKEGEAAAAATPEGESGAPEAKPEESAENA